MGVRNDYMTTTMSRELMDTFCGKKLGSGIGREVYENRMDPETVIKFEVGSFSFQNAMEWAVWNDLSYHKPSAKWLAPCVSISPCGLILIQKRTYPIPPKLLPTQIPSWATDEKPENWGLLDGKPVMHDYGYNMLISKGATVRLKKPHW